MRSSEFPLRDMTDFPTQLELIAASALLLLPVAVFYEKQNSQRTDFSDAIEVASKCEQSGTKRDNSITSGSISSDSSWMTSEATSGAVQARRMKIMSAFTAKLKELRRRRSKLHRSVHGCIVASRKPVNIRNVSETTTSEVSCISSGTSDLSSSRSRRKRAKKQATTGEELKGKRTISYNICLRAEAILNFLSVGCSSEVRIRQVLGDSPDTSKALRILLKRAEIKRTGAGGRSDPYIYRISAEAQEKPT